MDWKPLIRLPTRVPCASFITDDSFVLDKYKARVEKEFKNNPVLTVLNYQNGYVTGSNPFAVTLVNSIVEDYGCRVATFADLEKSLSLGALPLADHYEDTGLVLRSEDGPNEYLAKNLAEQARKRGFDLKEPLVLPLSGLEIVNDVNSERGLAFKLKKDIQIIKAPILMSGNEKYIDSSNMDTATGLPNRVYDSDIPGNNMKLSTRDSGLSRLCLDRDLDILSHNADLSDSQEYGRIVIICSRSGLSIAPGRLLSWPSPC